MLCISLDLHVVISSGLHIISDKLSLGFSCAIFCKIITISTTLCKLYADLFSKVQLVRPSVYLSMEAWIYVLSYLYLS